MRIEITETSEVIWLDQHRELSLMELVELSGLSIEELQHLVECEALQPVSGATTRALQGRLPGADAHRLAPAQRFRSRR
jgi:hypothetical protein